MLLGHFWGHFWGYFLCRLWPAFQMASPTPGWPSMLDPWPKIDLAARNLELGPSQDEQGLGKSGRESNLSEGKPLFVHLEYY